MTDVRIERVEGEGVSDETKVRGRVVRVGDHLTHRPSGEYLGQVVAISKSAMVFTVEGGPRGRTIATRYEVERTDGRQD